MADSSDRRNFLRRARNAFAEAAGRKLPDLSQGEKAKSVAPLVTTMTRRAMATDFELRYPVDCGDPEAALQALEALDALEERLSFFRLQSEISRINLLASEAPVAIEDDLFELLSEMMRLSEETEGAWDITSAPLWQLWGFAKRRGGVPSEGEIEDALKLVGRHLVELDAKRKTIRFKLPGMKINLGGVGKGYALDRCGKMLVDSGMNHFLLHGGRSSILARGDGEGAKASTESKGWAIGVVDPRRPNRRIGEILLKNGAIGSSGSQFQSFRHEGKKYGHIIDPRTGRPANQTEAVTVLAPTATLADALSTAFFVLGAEKTAEYVKKRPEIGVAMFPAGVRSEEMLRWNIADGVFVGR